MSIRHRDFHIEDAAAVDAIAVNAFAEYSAFFPDWAATADTFAETSKLSDRLELIVAEDADAMLGFVGYLAPGRPREAVFEPGWAAIRMLSVDPCARRRGVGRLLTRVCIERARRDGAPIIALHTSPQLTVAVAMYRRWGFAHVRDIADSHGLPHALYTLALHTGSARQPQSSVA